MRLSASWLPEQRRLLRCATAWKGRPNSGQLARGQGKALQAAPGAPAHIRGGNARWT